MTTIKRNTDGILDFILDKVDDIDSDTDIDIKTRVALIDKMMNHVWKAAHAAREHKKLMLRAPDIARNESIAVPLGSPQRGKRKPAA